MENATKPAENKKMPCCCGALLGVLVIVFAWWKVAWGGVALTVLGALIVIKELIGQCCCSSKTCPPKTDSKTGS